jgi:UDP:flavonoid glycosyltransferase YjiC (YdhE family)
MKFFITSIGTRGDVEPFLAIGEILQKHKHEVIYCFPEQFENLIPQSDTFYPLTPKFLELIESPEGIKIMGKASLWQKAKAVFKLAKKGKLVNKRITNQQFNAIQQESPNCIIHHPKCSLPIFWNLKNRITNIILSPVPFVFHSVKNHPHIGFPLYQNSTYCKITYCLAQFALVKSVYDSQKHLKDLPTYSKARIKTSLFKTPFIYAVSPQLIKRPVYFPRHVQILGYHERNKMLDWQPPQPLLEFLKTHPKVLFLTFGSMVNHNPQYISKMFYSVISTLKIPCIVNTAAGGLIPIDDFKTNKNFLFVSDVPYDWLYKHVYAVIHHGGSGTTHMSLKNGLPSLIIPHIVDQFMWNTIISKKKLGPKGISIHKVKPELLKELILDLYRTKEYKVNAELMATKMKDNSFEDKLVKFIMNKLASNLIA